MPVIYGGKSIIPAPEVTINQDIRETPDGRKLGTVITATLRGKISATMNDYTPNPLAIEHRLAVILQKQAALRAIFATDGQLFEVQGLDGTAPTKFNALVHSIDFPEGNWIEVCDYVVVLEGTYIAGEDFASDPYIESATHNWSFEEGEGPHTYRVVHTLTAKGRTVYDADGTLTSLAWQRAKDFVTNQLKLGITSTASPWSPTSGAGLLAAGNIQPDATGQYNRVIQENIDELDGTYGVTETYFIAQNPYWEDYSITVRRVANEPFYGTVVGIQGVIHGLYVNLHDIESKLINAKARWLALQPTLYSRASSYAPAGVTLNTHPVVAESVQNYDEGTITYTYEFNDRINTNDTLETYNIAQTTNDEDGKTTVTIDGWIKGEQYLDETFDPTLRYTRALARWDTVRALALSRCVSETGLSDLRAFPVSASMTPNKQEGIITYTFVFDNRIPESVKDDYTISTRYSREDGRTYINVEGTITGYRTAHADQPFQTNDLLERYNNALAYFNGASANFLGLATNYVDVSLVNTTPYSKQVNHVPLAGQITYNYEYNSIPQPCFPGALSEIITVTDDDATPVIAVIPVLGRPAGPVIQDMGTLKEKRRSLSVELVLPVAGTSKICNVAANPAPTVDITAFAPTGAQVVYLEQDQVSWSPTNGRYVRSASWIYV